MTFHVELHFPENFFTPFFDPANHLAVVLRILLSIDVRCHWWDFPTWPHALAHNLSHIGWKICEDGFCFGKCQYKLHLVLPHLLFKLPSTRIVITWVQGVWIMSANFFHSQFHDFSIFIRL